MTGATGFIGRHVLRCAIQQKYKVKALSRQSDPKTIDDAEITWVNGSLSDDGALRRLVKGVDSVVHCAGLIKSLSRLEFLSVNRDGTRALAEAAARERKGLRFVYLSSLAAREPKLSSYGASKRAGEQALTNFKKYLRPVVLRPPVVYGPGDIETLGIFKMAAAGLVLVPAVANARLSLVHADDVAAAVIRSLQLTESSLEPIELRDARQEGHSWQDVAEAAGAAVGKSPKIIKLPNGFVWVAGLAGSFAGLLLRRSTMLNLGKVPEILHSDWVGRGPDVPGWTPKWSIDNGFKNTVNWYCSQNMLKSYL